MLQVAADGLQDQRMDAVEQFARTLERAGRRRIGVQELARHGVGLHAVHLDIAKAGVTEARRERFCSGSLERVLEPDWLARGMLRSGRPPESSSSPVIIRTFCPAEPCTRRVGRPAKLWPRS